MASWNVFEKAPGGTLSGSIDYSVDVDLLKRPTRFFTRPGRSNPVVGMVVTTKDAVSGPIHGVTTMATKWDEEGVA